MNSDNSRAFEQAGRTRQGGIIRELFGFLRTHKKFWLVPIIVVLLGLGLLVMLGGTAAAPFIYTLF
jgi:hypothetical protein